MRTIPQPLAAALSEGATTLCHVWLLTRKDALTMGFTDHDCDLVIDGTIAKAATGFRGSDLAERLGLAVSGGEVAGALNDESILEADILSGLYDNARIDIYLVDWSAPENRMLLRRAFIGEISRQDGAFKAELRSIAHRLDETHGRLYTPQCGADLGDARCGIALDTPARTGTGTVVAPMDGESFTASGISSFADGRFVQGRLVWLDGANSGLSSEVRAHRLNGGIATLSLWHAMARPVKAGDRFTISLGCDKSFATCRDRFNNAMNFRGFPHMPGADFVLSYPLPGENQ